MIGLRIGAAERAEIEAGAPCVVLAPGLLLPHLPPLLPLTPKDGVLVRPGGDTRRTLPLPADFRPLALIAPADHAPAIAALLPPDTPVHAHPGELPAILVAALVEAGHARRAAEAERRRLLRALGADPPRPKRVLDAPPGEGRATPPLRQSLGLPADGLCTVELHLPGPVGPGAPPLRLRLVAGARALGMWEVPAAALAAGWLALDLPEPAAGDTAEAVLEVLEGPPLSTQGAAAAPLALRLWTAGPGWSVLPRHFAWHAAGAPHPALPLPLPRAVLAEAVVEGGSAELVALGEEAARLIITIPPEGEARVLLPPVATGAADLLRARLATITGAASSFELRVEGAETTAGTGWRPTGPDAVFLALPGGPMARLAVLLRQPGTVPATVEIGELALLAGAAGEPRPAPVAQGAGRRRASLAPGLTAEGAGWRSGPPAPRLTAALPGGAPPLPIPAAYEAVVLNQHLANGDGSYGHLDLRINGLVSGGGLWRQVRVKLFERRGVIGLEFREMKGWPPMFDAWPSGQKDQFGPFWRLETRGTAEALAGLATPHDRALVAALLEVLPDLARGGARAAGLTGVEAELWPARARKLDAAVNAARAAR